MEEDMQLLAKGALGALVLAVAAFSATKGMAQDKVTLRMVGSFPIGPSPTAEIGNKFMESVNRLGEGKVEITYLGASDVVPTFDQPEALVNGVFDVWYGAPNYWAGVVPGGDVTELSPFKIADQGPGSEIYEFLVGLFEEKGVRYLAHAAADVGVGTHFLSTNFEVDSIDDLSGKKIRVAPLLRHVVEAAGAEPITLPPSDIYLAIERGTVDGFTWPVADGYTRNGWQTVTKYLVNQPMYRSGAGLAMNLAKWDSLSEEVQSILLEAVVESQEFAHEWFAQNESEQMDLMKEGGMQVLDLPEEESQKWDEVANDALWEYYKGVMTEEQIAEVSRLLERE
jgi:TRAP-type C4-dicarboxylate transport system substrate-binding protein